MSEQQLHFRVRSSSSNEIYDVKATLVPRLKITCTCQAGMHGLICKHRTALLLQDAASVVDVKIGDTESLSNAAANSELGTAIRQMADLEAEMEKLKKKLAALKKKVARFMNGESDSKAEYAARY